MEVIISAGDTDKAQDIASLRAWLHAASPSAPWVIAGEAAGTAGHLGFGVDEICAVLAAIEGLPPLITQIKSWFTTRQDPIPVTLTITVDPASGDVTIVVPGKE